MFGQSLLSLASTKHAIHHLWGKISWENVQSLKVCSEEKTCDTKPVWRIICNRMARAFSLLTRAWHLVVTLKVYLS